MKAFISLFIPLALLFSCQNMTKEKPQTILVSQPVDTLRTDSLALARPIFGHRFMLVGDFDANGIQDTFTEHFYSNRDHEETNKYFSGADDMWVLYDSAYAKDCISFMTCNNSKLDTIPISGILGPIFVKNEGDLDQDGGDEVSYVPSLPQQSSMNHCKIISFKKGKWKEVYSFEIREWQIPQLPQAGKTYGLMGMDGAYYIDENDTLNQALEQQFNEFPGFITKLKSGKIEIVTFTEIAEDTVLTIDLKKHPKRFN